MIAHNAKSRLKNPLIVLAAYALLNAIIYSLGGFLLADGWSSIGSSTYRDFLHFIFFWVWPLIIGISIIHILSIIVDKKNAIASLKFALLLGFAGLLTLYILISTSDDPIAGMAYILSAAYYCVFAVVGFIISSIVIWAYNKNKTKWISLPSFTKRMIAFIAVAAIIIFISLIINNYVFTPPPVAFPVEKNVYTLYAKVYNSRGHEEFVKNFEESYKTLKSHTKLCQRLLTGKSFIFYYWSFYIAILMQATGLFSVGKYKKIIIHSGNSYVLSPILMISKKSPGRNGLKLRYWLVHSKPMSIILMLASKQPCKERF